MLVPDLLTGAAEQYPGKDAVVFASDRQSFAELHRRSGQVAARLRHHGIGTGHCVAILYENTPAALVYYWGVQKSGAVSVDIPCTMSVEQAVSSLGECEPAAIALSRPQIRRLTAGSPRLKLPSIVLTDGGGDRSSVETLEHIVANESVDSERASAVETDVAMIMYTSGSTGRSKGVMLSHQNVISNIQAANSVMQLGSDERLLLVVPFHFIHGRMQILSHALIGGTIIVSEGFQFPQNVLRELIHYQVTGLSGVPFHFRALLDRTNMRSTAFSCLRYILITGGALPPDGIRELSNALPGVEIHIAYGQTEASPRITYLKPSDVFYKVGSCGQALPGVDVKIVGEDGVIQSPGEIGEVVVSGPNVMLGYVSHDEREDGVIDDQGRLHTGDLARMDAEGYAYLVGRKSAMIKTAGERVFPAEIEETIGTHPEIEESAVIGVPDDMLGEMIVAFVVPVSGARIQEAEIRHRCLRDLPFVRVPKEIRIVRKLPRTASGKVDRAALMRAHTAARAGSGPS